MSNKIYLIIILSSGALQWRNGAIFCQNYFTSINPWVWLGYWFNHHRSIHHHENYDKVCWFNRKTKTYHATLKATDILSFFFRGLPQELPILHGPLKQYFDIWHNIKVSRFIWYYVSWCSIFTLQVNLKVAKVINLI